MKNAEEFETVLQNLRGVLSRAFVADDGRRSDLQELNKLCGQLNEHGAEMKAAEAKPLPQYKPDIRVSEGALRRAREINEPNKRIEAIEKRLDEMPARFRKAMTAHFYDQTKRIKAIEEQNSQLDGRLNCHKRWVDATEGKAADEGLDNLAKEHERVVASIRRLTAAVRAAAAEDAKPAPPIEVEMRTRYKSSNVVCYWAWGHRLAGTVFREIGDVRYTSAQFAKNVGDTWLAALSKKLGVPLVAKWVEDA